MNDVPSSHEPWDDVDALYRRASALDPSRPSASVDSAILAHAARVAAERSPDAGDSGPSQRAQSRADANASSARAGWRAWWRPAVFGTLAAAGLAGLLVLPQALTPRVSPATKYTRELSESGLVAQRAAEPSRPQVARQESQAPVAPAAKEMAPAIASAPAAPAPTNSAASDAAAPTRKAPVAPAATAPAPTTSVASAPTAPAPASSVTPTDATSASAIALADARRTAPVPPAARRQSARVEDKDQGVLGGYEDVTVTGQRRTENDTATSPISDLSSENSASGLKEEVQVSKPPGSPAALFQAARTGDLRKLQAALDEHTDINSRDQTGATALLLATRSGQQQAVEMLLAKGADPDISDSAGLTPLMEATAGGRSAIARVLKRAGAH